MAAFPDRAGPGDAGPRDRVRGGARRPRRDAHRRHRRSPQCPNAVLDLLSFPYVLRGALDVQATRITDGMLLAAARRARRSGARGGRRRGQPRLRARALHVRARSTCCRSPSIRASSCAVPPPSRGGPWRRAWRGSPSMPSATRRSLRVRIGTGPRDHAAAHGEGAPGVPARRVPRGAPRDDPPRLQHPRRRGDRAADPARQRGRRSGGPPRTWASMPPA